MLVLIIIVLLIILIIILNYKNKNRDYKIYNFKINTLILSIYFSMFFCLLVYLRISRWGLTLDLCEIFNKLQNIFRGLNILIIIIIFLLCCIAYGILIQLKIFFIRELIKRHLYVYFNRMYKDLLSHVAQNKNISSEVIKYQPYVRLIKKLGGIWSYDSIIRNYIYVNFILPYSIITEKDTYPFWMDDPLKNFLNLIHKIILIILILYECFFNNWTLHLVFYYLPLYFIITIYKNITSFLDTTNNELNRIIYERYYEEDNVLYINTTIVEDTFILNYITNGFKCFSYSVDTWEEKRFFFNFPVLFIKKCRFYKTKTPFIFQNSNGEQIDSREIILETIYK